MDMQKLEKSLEDVYKNTPALPKSFKDLLVQLAPWLTLAGGIFSVLSVYWIWQWAHTASVLTEYVNTISVMYGRGETISNRMSFWVWLSLIVVAVQGIVYLMAFNPLRERKVSGWRLLFYVAVINVAYGVVSAFTSYGSGGFGNFILGLIGSAIGLYFLFQIKGLYSNVKSVATHTKHK